MKPSAPVFRCPACSSRLEPDGVCLACFFKEAAAAPLADVQSGLTLTTA